MTWSGRDRRNARTEPCTKTTTAAIICLKNVSLVGIPPTSQQSGNFRQLLLPDICPMMFGWHGSHKHLMMQPLNLLASPPSRLPRKFLTLSSRALEKAGIGSGRSGIAVIVLPGCSASWSRASCLVSVECVPMTSSPFVVEKGSRMLPCVVLLSSGAEPSFAKEGRRRLIWYLYLMYLFDPALHTKWLASSKSGSHP